MSTNDTTIANTIATTKDSSGLTASLLMTIPRVVRLLLMLDPSLRRSPVAPVLLARSEPARSTKERRDTFTPLTPEAASVMLKVTRMVKTAWDLLDSLFMLVAATVRDLFPSAQGGLKGLTYHKVLYFLGIEHTQLVESLHIGAQHTVLPHLGLLTPHPHLQASLLVPGQVEQVKHLLVVDLHVAHLDGL